MQIELAEEVLIEFIKDVKADGVKNVKRDWPDLWWTYRKAKRALEEM